MRSCMISDCSFCQVLLPVSNCAARPHKIVHAYTLRDTRSTMPQLAPPEASSVHALHNSQASLHVGMQGTRAQQLGVSGIRGCRDSSGFCARQGAWKKQNLDRALLACVSLDGAQQRGVLEQQAAVPERLHRAQRAVDARLHLRAQAGRHTLVTRLQEPLCCPSRKPSTSAPNRGSGPQSISPHAMTCRCHSAVCIVGTHRHMLATNWLEM